MDSASPLRIVSCIASATEIVHALGLGVFQVGRSHECDWPPAVRNLPVITQPRFDIHGNSAQIDQRVKDTLKDAGSVYEVFTELLDSLAPTHILTQTQCRVCAVSLADVQDALSKNFQSRPQVIALEPTCLTEIYQDIQRVAAGCQVPEQGANLVASVQAGIDQISSRAKSSSRQPSVVCIEWPEPIMAAGNWIPELVAQAHGLSPLGNAGSYSPYITFAELQAADPDILVIMPCGYDLTKTGQELHWLTGRAGWQNLKAVQNDRVYICDANQYMTRPGPRVLDSVRALAEMLHPELFEPTLKGIAWLPCAPATKY